MSILLWNLDVGIDAGINIVVYHIARIGTPVCIYKRIGTRIRICIGNPTSID